MAFTVESREAIVAALNMAISTARAQWDMANLLYDKDAMANADRLEEKFKTALEQLP